MVNLRTIEHYSTFDKAGSSSNQEQIKQVIGDDENISTINQVHQEKTPVQSIQNPFIGSSANIAITNDSRQSPSNKYSSSGRN